mmetsp:Transcript_38107/g.104921  ORF Transcript_38107/g.104921 Transcript_38107/m.104921 type:complete len:259 (-) Transcript_38107:215-991(-)
MELAGSTVCVSNPFRDERQCCSIFGAPDVGDSSRALTSPVLGRTFGGVEATLPVAAAEAAGRLFLPASVGARVCLLDKDLAGAARGVDLSGFAGDVFCAFSDVASAPLPRGVSFFGAAPAVFGGASATTEDGAATSAFSCEAPALAGVGGTAHTPSATRFAAPMLALAASRALLSASVKPNSASGAGAPAPPSVSPNFGTDDGTGGCDGTLLTSRTTSVTQATIARDLGSVHGPDTSSLIPSLLSSSSTSVGVFPTEA